MLKLDKAFSQTLAHYPMYVYTYPQRGQRAISTGRKITIISSTYSIYYYVPGSLQNTFVITYIYLKAVTIPILWVKNKDTEGILT